MSIVEYVLSSFPVDKLDSQSRKGTFGSRDVEPNGSEKRNQKVQMCPFEEDKTRDIKQENDDNVKISEKV